MTRERFGLWFSVTVSVIMTVEHVAGEKVACMWFMNGELYQREYASAVLKFDDRGRS